MLRWLELRIPPLALLVIFGAASAGAAAAAPALYLPFPGSGALSLTASVAGAALALLGVVEFCRARTTVNPIDPARAARLVARGVYRFSRNPMYLGFVLLLLAAALWLSHLMAFVLVPAFVAYLNRFQIEPEERALAARFGAEFSAYAKAVRRWI